MDGLKNFLPLSRDIRQHWIYSDSQYLHVWIEMLFAARFSKEPQKNIYKGTLYTINYGEFIFGRPSWSKKMKISEQRLKTLISKLEKENMICKVKKFSRFTIYSIVNYEKFNQQNNQHSNQQPAVENSDITVCANQHNNQHSNHQVTSIQPASNQQVTNKEESKECSKNVKNVNKTYCPNSNEFRLASYLFNYIKRNNPKAKQPNMQTWSKQFDYILRIDKRDIEEVKEVIKWCQDDSFWYQNILSPDKLRKQYDRLLIKIKPKEANDGTNKRKFEEPEEGQGITL